MRGRHSTGDQCRVAKQVAMSVDSRFDIASVTKTFVAVLCARLAAQGKLDVDAHGMTEVPWSEKYWGDVTGIAALKEGREPKGSAYSNVVK